MKVFLSLPQELEDEALANFDQQGDQIVFGSGKLLTLTSVERQSPEWAHHYMAMFWYVFGYAQAKGYTSSKMRMQARFATV